MSTILKGDFIGFSFNGTHSSELGIVRTSDGSRFNDNLLPTSQDTTQSVAGRDETYYFDTNYTQRTFNLSIAFDKLTEVNLRKLRQLLSLKDVAELIFDEMPYKIYMAKVVSNPILKYICFDADDGQRIYKGEGTINFTAYYPFARSRYKYLDEYTEHYSDIKSWVNFESNMNEWSTASGMKETQKITIQDTNLLPYISSSGTAGGITYTLNSDSTITAEGTATSMSAFNLHTITLAAGTYRLLGCPSGGSPTTYKIAATAQAGLIGPFVDVGAGTVFTLTGTTTLNVDCTISSGTTVDNIVFKPILTSYQYDVDFIYNTSDLYNHKFTLANTGDMPTDFILYIPLSDETDTLTFYLNNINADSIKMVLTDIVKFNDDIGICINTRTQLIEGIDENNNKTGTLYNKYITNGDFFQLPQSVYQNNNYAGIELDITSLNNTNTFTIEYSYLYY